MISKYSSSRTLKDNLVLGSLTSFTAGAVNVLSFLLFFSFTSNITGYYAILSAELAKGNLFQISIVLSWIFLFFIGGFVSNIIVISTINRGKVYLGHFLPIAIEILCIGGVGIYGQFLYQETFFESGVLLSVLLFAMGLQNGFTASISNFAVKTTHLTGATTDMAILFALFTQKKFRENGELKAKAKVLIIVSTFYVTGGFFSAYVQINYGFSSFYVTCALLVIVMLYDFSRIRSINREFSRPDKPVLETDGFVNENEQETMPTQTVRL